MGVRLCLIIQMRISLMLPKSVCRTQLGGGEPMQSAFSYSEIEKLLEKHGFLIYELLTPDDIQRDIIDKAGADMKAFEHVNYCLAVRKN